MQHRHWSAPHQIVSVLVRRHRSQPTTAPAVDHLMARSPASPCTADNVERELPPSLPYPRGAAPSDPLLSIATAEWTERHTDLSSLGSGALRPVCRCRVNLAGVRQA